MAKGTSGKEITNCREVRIQFDLDAKEQQAIRTETLWGEETSPGHYRILNSPFFAFNVSAEDIVDGETIDATLLRFKGIVARGGHSTYRLFLQQGRTIQDPEFMRHWLPISQLGPTFENANDHFVSIDVPKGVDTEEVYKLMQNGENDGLWIFEVAHHFSHLE